MIDIFLHRQNDSEEISESGIEIDIRSSINGLVLNHDRLNHSDTYPLLKDKLNLFKEKNIILNIKESGIEEELIDMMKDHDYYFLDSQIPDILRLSKKYPEIAHRFIVRLSDVELPSNKFISLIKPKYMWLDYSEFDNFDSKQYRQFVSRMLYLSSRYQHFIVVSPELYSLEYVRHIESVKKTIFENVGPFSICTKYPQLWRN